MPSIPSSLTLFTATHTLFGASPSHVPNLPTLDDLQRHAQAAADVLPVPAYTSRPTITAAAPITQKVQVSTGTIGPPPRYTASKPWTGKNSGSLNSGGESKLVKQRSAGWIKVQDTIPGEVTMCPSSPYGPSRMQGKQPTLDELMGLPYDVDQAHPSPCIWRWIKDDLPHVQVII